MFLFFLLIVSSVVGFLLIGLQEIGLVIGFAIIVGCLIRGLYLLHEINRKLDREGEYLKTTPIENEVYPRVNNH